MTIVQGFKTTFHVVRMAYTSRLYPRAKPRGFTLQWINLNLDVAFCLNLAFAHPTRKFYETSA